MGMVGYFTSINREALENLQSDPDQMENFLFPNDGDDEPENTIDVDKAWHGIHFILSEIAKNGRNELESAVLGGAPLGEDLGYGPPRVLNPSEVKQIAAALSSISSEQFESTFDPAAMEAAEIYPQIWERDGKEALEYLTDYFPTLVTFYAEAASRGDGVVLWLA